ALLASHASMVPCARPRAGSVPAGASAAVLALVPARGGVVPPLRLVGLGGSPGVAARLGLLLGRLLGRLLGGLLARLLGGLLRRLLARLLGRLLGGLLAGLLRRLRRLGGGRRRRRRDVAALAGLVVQAHALGEGEHLL